VTVRFILSFCFCVFAVSWSSKSEAIDTHYDREAIRRKIIENLRPIRTCYEAELGKSPNLKGKVVLSWTIGDKGQVTKADIKSNELGNDAVPNCIIGLIKTWTFPKPPPKQTIDVDGYPFFFSN